VRGLISRSSLCNVAIECTENVAGGLIYDHFPWLETTLVHISGVFHETKTPAPIRYAPVPDRRAPFPATSPAVATAVAKNFKAFTKCSPKRCVRPDKRQVSWVDQVRDSKLEFLAGMTFLAGGSNKCSNKKLRYRKMLVTSVLSITTIALLRRWLWVRAPPNPIFRLAGSMRSMATQ